MTIRDQILSKLRDKPGQHFRLDNIATSIDAGISSVRQSISQLVLEGNVRQVKEMRLALYYVPTEAQLASEQAERLRIRPFRAYTPNEAVRANQDRARAARALGKSVG